MGAEEVTMPDDNILEVSDETTGNGAYVLANISGEPGFYKWSGGELGSGRVYLPATIAPSRGFFAFNFGVATGIETVEQSTSGNGHYYNLNGQRVMAPSKGLYIINGKRVVIK